MGFTDLVGSIPFETLLLYLSALLIPLLFSVYNLTQSDGSKYIKKEWGNYKVLERRVVSEGERPVIFLTIGGEMKGGEGGVTQRRTAHG